MARARSGGPSPQRRSISRSALISRFDSIVRIPRISRCCRRANRIGRCASHTSRGPRTRIWRAVLLPPDGRAALLRILADRAGLTGALSAALARRGWWPVHDRGRVLTDVAVMVADGG